MAAENALAFIRTIARGGPVASIVAIAGPQEFLREYVLDALRSRLSRDGFAYRSFQIGGSDSFAAVISELDGSDLFAPKRLISCRVLKSRRGRSEDSDDSDNSGSGGAGGSGESALAEALARIDDRVRVVMLYERDTVAAKVRRVAEKSGTVVNCLRPFDNQITQYAEAFARVAGLALSSGAAELLANRHGNDLAEISNSIHKAAITCGEGGKIEAADLADSGSRHVPDIFEIAEDVARGKVAEALSLFDRAVQTGRDPIEILATEIIPLLRRMLIAAALLSHRKGPAEIARTLGFSPTSTLLNRAIDGARHYGLERLERAHQRASQLDAAFKTGLIKEREQAISAMLLELMGAESPG